MIKGDMMDEKAVDMRKEVMMTILILPIIFLPGVVADIFYRIGDKLWTTWGLVVLLRSIGITYSSSFDILNSSFGVIVSMVSMFLTINNNISERFEKKVFGISRGKLFTEDSFVKGFLFEYFKRVCLCAPVFMLLFLNLEFCVSGYLVFAYCILFLLWHYYRYDSSYSKRKSLEKTVQKLKDDLPKEDVWTEDILSEYQISLECIGGSAEEDNNWKEVENLYYEMLDATEKYDYYKRYLIAFYFYRTVFWRRKNRNQIMPMHMMQLYLNRLDKRLGKKILEKIPSDELSVLWGMMRVAVCEASEYELIHFIENFLDFPGRGCNVLKGNENGHIKLRIMEEQTGMLLFLIEYRFGTTLPRDVRFIELLRKIWEISRKPFDKEKDYECIPDILLFISNSLEEDRLGLETVLENLKYDFNRHSKMSLIANIITIEMPR